MDAGERWFVVANDYQFDTLEEAKTYALEVSRCRKERVSIREYADYSVFHETHEQVTPRHWPGIEPHELGG